MKIKSAVALLSTAFCITSFARGQTLEWTRQLGTVNFDESTAVSADRVGNVYISGHTRGSLNGENSGNSDAFLAKYDASGIHQWTQQLGTSEWDASSGVSADGLGNVYISGSTEGNLEGANLGSSDAFVAKYDASGTLDWTRQLGTNFADESLGVSADGLGNVYISGLHFVGPGAPVGDAFLH